MTGRASARKAIERGIRLIWRTGDQAGSEPVKNKDSTALKSRLDSATLLLTLIDGFGF